MHTVIWSIQPNEGTSRKDIEYELEASKKDYTGSAGLQHYTFGLSADNKSVIEVSTWDSKAAADAFFSEARGTNLARRWQSAPMSRQDWETLAIA